MTTVMCCGWVGRRRTRARARVCTLPLSRFHPVATAPVRFLPRRRNRITHTSRPPPPQKPLSPPLHPPTPTSSARSPPPPKVRPPRPTDKSSAGVTDVFSGIAPPPPRPIRARVHDVRRGRHAWLRTHARTQRTHRRRTATANFRTPIINTDVAHRGRVSPPP